MIAIARDAISILLSLLRTAVRGDPLNEEERENVTPGRFSELLALSKRHDVAHLMALGLDQNGLLRGEDTPIANEMIKAVYRHEQLNYAYGELCRALEGAEIPFLPLKGAVLKSYYPEPWMRTSCDIDVLVRREHLDAAISCLVHTLQYEEKEHDTHDVSLYTPQGVHIELHFDLVEEGRANHAIRVLKDAWEHATPKAGHPYWYELTDAFFYFYHIAHMAKHFEVGGCGMRPFIDLWILDHIEGAETAARDALLQKGELFKFAEACRRLSRCWMEDAPLDALSQQLQDYIISGGVYGTAQNRVALQQQRKGGRIGYLLSRIFIPFAKLKRYYPILEKHPWLMPVMQVRRWFMLLRPSVAKMAKRELAANHAIDRSKNDHMKDFLQEIGL